MRTFGRATLRRHVPRPRDAARRMFARRVPVSVVLALLASGCLQTAPTHVGPHRMPPQPIVPPVATAANPTTRPSAVPLAAPVAFPKPPATESVAHGDSPGWKRSAPVASPTARAEAVGPVVPASATSPSTPKFLPHAPVADVRLAGAETAAPPLVPPPPAPASSATNADDPASRPAPDAVPTFAPVVPDQGASLPIDLATALQLAAGENPQVGFAKQRIAESYAQRLQADALWLPSIRAGANYNKHDGRIQDVAGRIIETERGSVYAGLGAQAVGAGSPSVPGLLMAFHVKDALFQPVIADRALGARQQASRATTNDVLLDVALAYQDLLEAAQTRAVALETVGHSRRLAELTADFARTGQGLPSDSDRARTDLALREVEAQRASESVRVASTRLARLIRQDQSLSLAPQEPVLLPVELVAPEVPLPELVAIGLENRPELAENRFLVGEAVQRLRREKYSPLVPSVLLGMSYGTNGGGLYDELVRFGDRIDFDAVAFWEVRNLGLGERNARAEARARVEQARWRQAQVMDQVAADVAEAHAQVESRRMQVGLAENGIGAARDSHRRNLERIREGQGLPIETLQAIVALDQVQRQYVRAVADFNRAQFRLHRALGWPEQIAVGADVGN